MRVPSIAFLVLATVLPFALAFGGIAAAVHHGADVEERIRLARSGRTDALRFQLDEESALLSYIGTRSPVSLQKFVRAERGFNDNDPILRAALASLAPEALSLVDDQDTVHRTWLNQIAEPLIARQEPGTPLALELKGMQLLGRFQKDNDSILRLLDDAARHSEVFARTLVDVVIGIGLTLGTALLVTMLWIGDRHQYIANELRVRNALYQREREIADALKDALIPSDLPSLPGLQLCAQYRTAQEPERVGGDWYDAFPMSDGRLFIVIGDVTGHGIEAIGRMTRLRTSIISAALQERDPGNILSSANRQLLQSADDHKFGTAICALIDPATCEITYAIAGHPAPILVIPNEEPRVLVSADLMLGIEKCAYQTLRAHACPAALLVFYTDGLLELRQDVLQGEVDLLEAARSTAIRNTQDAALAIETRVLGNVDPQDDIAILTIAFTPNDSTSHGAQAEPSVTAIRMT